MAADIQHGATDAGGEDDPNRLEAEEFSALIDKHGISASKIDELRATHGDVYVMKLFPVVFKRCKPAHWRRFIKEAGDEKTKAEGIENFARSLVVWPEKTALEAIVNDSPAVLTKLCADGSALAGRDSPTHSRKAPAASS